MIVIEVVRPPSAIAFYNNMFHQTEGLGSFDLLTIITLVITIIALIVAI